MRWSEHDDDDDDDDDDGDDDDDDDDDGLKVMRKQLKEVQEEAIRSAWLYTNTGAHTYKNTYTAVKPQPQTQSNIHRHNHTYTNTQAARQTPEWQS